MKLLQAYFLRTIPNIVAAQKENQEDYASLSLSYLKLSELERFETH